MYSIFAHLFFFLFFIHIYNSRQKYRISSKSNKEHCLPRGLFTPYRTPVRNAFTVVRHRGCSCRVGMLIVCRARSSLRLQVLLFVWSFRRGSLLKNIFIFILYFLSFYILYQSRICKSFKQTSNFKVHRNCFK